MNKLTAEPSIIPPLTADEQAQYDARTRQGLAEAERGEGITVAEARERMNERVASLQSHKD